MSDVIANAFRPGYSLRTFQNTKMFDHRDDNVQRPIKSLLYSIKVDSLDFNIKFNINSIEFCSRLNEHFHKKWLTTNFYQEMTSVISRDY